MPERMPLTALLRSASAKQQLRRFAAELERGRDTTPVAAASATLLTAKIRAGKRHLARQGMSHQRFAGFVPEPGNHVDHARRQYRFQLHNLRKFER